MEAKKIKLINGTVIPLVEDDIDTDRIIPARYMKGLTFEGLGDYVFYDVRHTDTGEITKHPLDDSKYRDADILLTGKNFGCGSSREHAPQSLLRSGIKAIIAESFAEIFFGNASTLGLVCITLGYEDIKTLEKIVLETPSEKVIIDIDLKKIIYGSVTTDFSIPESTRGSLLNGSYDSLYLLLENMDKIQQTEAELEYSFHIEE